MLKNVPSCPCLSVPVPKIICWPHWEELVPVSCSRGDFQGASAEGSHWVWNCPDGDLLPTAVGGECRGLLTLTWLPVSGTVLKSPRMSCLTFVIK